MNLTIDIGNSNVMICVFKNNKIFKHEKVNVINFSKDDQYSFFKKLFMKYKILFLTHFSLSVRFNSFEGLLVIKRKEK